MFIDGYRWIATDTPVAVRYDDMCFLGPDLGWTVNGNGQILKTDDGGATWQVQATFANVYLRSIAMADERVGWVGSTTPGRQLFCTEDGGATWREVDGLPGDAPSAVCGLWAINARQVVASGTNFPERPARFMRSDDGGKTWNVRRMDDLAALLVDIYFTSEVDGWVVGGRGTTDNPSRADVVPVVLRTRDGGKSWTDMLGDGDSAALGEWGWKIQFVDDRFGLVACENYDAGAVLITEDGGETWRRQEIRDAGGEMINGNLEGVGFWDRERGWVGGWGDRLFQSGRTSGTRDGGKTWSDLSHDWPRPLHHDPTEPARGLGQYLNRFCFAGDSANKVAYAAGNVIYKYTGQELFEPAEGELASTRLLGSADPIMYSDTADGVAGVAGVDIGVTVPHGATSLSVNIYDRFAGKVRTLVDERDPAPGERVVTWNLRDAAGMLVAPVASPSTDMNVPRSAGQFMVRATVDGPQGQVAESRLIVRRRSAAELAVRNAPPHRLRPR